MTRKKKDKWRILLIQTQRQAEARIQEVKQLLEAQEQLMHKEAVLQQIIKGLSLLAELMAASAEHLSAAGDDNTHTRARQMMDQVLDALMQLELQIQLAVISSPGAACSSSQPSGNAQLLRCIFEPAELQKVKQMTDEDIIARLRALAGKCAIMLLQDTSQAALWGPSGTSLGMSLTTSSLTSVTSSVQQQPSSADGRAAAPAAAGGSSGAEQPQERQQPQERSPEFEYNCLAAGLLLSDVERFMRIGFVCLEDGRGPMPVLPQDFWRNVARKLQLTAHQIATLKSLRDLVHAAMSGTFANLASSTQQQAELIQQHQSRLQQLQALPQQEEEQKKQANGQVGAAGSGRQVSVGQQEEALNRQDASLKQWYLLWLWMGIVTSNTLTPRQMATLVSGSYPSIVRIDPILQFLDELEPYQPPEQLASMQQLRLA